MKSRVGRPVLTRLRRVTTSGQFIPEIDGLRFVAIGAVVLFHVAVNLVAKDSQAWTGPTRGNPVSAAAFSGSFGVQLFFVISGFILALPFARHHLQGARSVSLKRYFMRRLTRLEPPYVVAMTLIFVILLMREGPGQLLPHYVASLLYDHNLVFGEESLINNVAWSLEIEIQFYVLVPWLTLLFAIRSVRARRGAVVAAICGSAALSALFITPGTRPYFSILNFAQYFLLGFLLADLHLGGFLTAARSYRWDVASLLGWPALIAAVASLSDVPNTSPRAAVMAVIIPAIVLALYAAAFRGRITNRLFTKPWLTAVGGMCYSIYLLHNPLLGFVLSKTAAFHPLSSWTGNYLLQVLLTVPVVLLVCGVFFLMVERPCMRPDWPQRLRDRLALRLGAASPGVRGQPGTLPPRPQQDMVRDPS